MLNSFDMVGSRKTVENLRKSPSCILRNTFAKCFKQEEEENECHRRDSDSEPRCMQERANERERAILKEKGLDERDDDDDAASRSQTSFPSPFHFVAVAAILPRLLSSHNDLTE